MVLEHEVVQVRSETTFDRGGAAVEWKVVTFYIGRSGPHIERFKADEFTSANVQARIQQLKTHLELLGMK